MSLAAFIRDLYRNECEFKVEPEITHQLEKVVTTVVKEVIPTALSLLSASKGSFSIEAIENAGSYFEQTKIIAPDEYDFMLVVRELSEPNAIAFSRGCRKGYVKVKTVDQERWGWVSSEQTPDRSFQIAVLQFNMYVRQALELFNAGLQSFESRDGELLFKNVVSRGKPYKQFSFVQTAYFQWRYFKSQTLGEQYERHASDSGVGKSNNTSERVGETNVNEGLLDNSDQQVDIDLEILYSRLQNLTLQESSNEASPRRFDQGKGFETLDLDVDLMACCRVPLDMLSDFLPKEALENQLLAKNGLHIVLKPCGNPKCMEEDTECRLISYTKSEQELMRNLHPNWKIVYKFLKFVFHFSEVLGVDSYKLKSAVLHLSQKPGAPVYISTDQCMRSIMTFLTHASSKNYMPSFFNSELNVWNISPYFRYIVKWDIQLLSLLLSGIDGTSISDYDYVRFRRILQVKIEQFCDSRNMTALIDLERAINNSEFEKFCVQGNVFLDVVRGMEAELKPHVAFKYVAFKMKCKVCLDLSKEIVRCLFNKAWNAVRTLIFPQRMH